MWCERNLSSLPVNDHLLLSAGAKNIISGNNNFLGQLVDANIPAAVDANVLTNTVGTVTGSGAGGAASPVSALSRNIANQAGNAISSMYFSTHFVPQLNPFPFAAGPRNVVTGDNNFFGQLVDANIPAAVGANILTNTVGTVTGSGAGGNPVSSVLSTGSSIPRNIANLGGNTITCRCPFAICQREFLQYYLHFQLVPKISLVEITISLANLWVSMCLRLWMPMC